MPTGYEKYPRLYGSKAWKYLRLQIFKRDGYVCALCNRPTRRPHADHIEPHEGNIELFYDEGNIQTLCPTCHDGRKRIQENKGYSPACDENGIPIDNNHPWNRKK